MNITRKEKIIIIAIVSLGLVSATTGQMAIEYDVGPAFLFYSFPPFILSGVTGLILLAFSPHSFVSGLNDEFGRTITVLITWASIPFFIHMTKGRKMKRRIPYTYFLATYFTYVLFYLFQVSGFSE